MKSDFSVKLTPTNQMGGDMKKIECTIRFITPAFLGDAEQNGAWRSPPFKALLRQWWRVIVAREHGYDYRTVREAEGLLFGHAWLEKTGRGVWAAQSRVRMRLDRWRTGELTQWPKDHKIPHPEVQKTPAIGSHLYLGYGPLTFTKGTVLQKQCAIDVGEEARLRLGFPVREEPTLMKTLQLISWFGTAGSRSRNGWGSISLNHGRLVSQRDLLHGKADDFLKDLTRPLKECLSQEWPHAIGRDDKGPLIWKMPNSRDNWSEAMKDLAQVKIVFRTRLPFNGAGGDFFDRHLLAYPVTHHDVRAWGKKSRLANQLRFKVIQEEGGKYTPVAYHLPCGLPRELLDKLNTREREKLTPAHQAEVWRQVHEKIGQHMIRIQGGR
jgi:CRISPR-associated protein Cmr1